MDAIVYDARMLYNRHSSHSTRIMVSIVATNAIDSSSRTRMIPGLLAKAPTLARFINDIYGKIAPPCRSGIPENSSRQRGEHPPGMLLFSLVIQPLILEIEARCNRDLNR